MQVDSLLVHMHMFNLNPAFYTLPKELRPSSAPLFEHRQGRVQLCEQFKKLRNRPFTRFWFPACDVDESMWQKWVHMHTLRLLLVEDDLMPKQVFTRSDKTRQTDEISCSASSRRVIELLARQSSFTLLRDRCFVKFVLDDEGGNDAGAEAEPDSPPKFFYIIRAHFDVPCVILKIAFLGGMDSHKRAEVSEICQVLE